MIHDHLPSKDGGSLSLRWRTFGFSGQEEALTHLPVPARFACAAGNNNGQQKRSTQTSMSKVIVRLRRLQRVSGPHCVTLLPNSGANRYTTAGYKTNSFCGRIEQPLYNVAAIHHYYSRSRQEYVHKRKRGDVVWRDSNTTNELIVLAAQGLDWKHPTNPGGIQAMPQPRIFDDTVWQTFSRKLPHRVSALQNDPVAAADLVRVAQNWTCPGAPYEHGPAAQAVRQQLIADQQALQRALTVAKQKAQEEKKKKNQTPTKTKKIMTMNQIAKNMKMTTLGSKTTKLTR